MAPKCFSHHGGKSLLSGRSEGYRFYMSPSEGQDAGSLTQIFWQAVPAKTDLSEPKTIVRHALRCLEAFETGRVRHPKTGKPASLPELLAEMGMQENLLYASPELVRGESFDERSLVFTLGVLIFEQLTGRHPFGTSDRQVRLARIRRGEMGSGVNFFPQVPRDLRAILMRAMGPFPEERYSSLKAMKRALRLFGEGITSEDGGAAEDEPTSKIEKVGAKDVPSKFFEAPTRVAPAPQGLPAEAVQQLVSGGQDLPEWMEPATEEDAKRRRMHAAPTPKQPLQKTDLSEAELFDDISDDPSTSRAVELLTPSRKKVITTPVQPGSAFLADETRRAPGKVAKLAPLLYGLIGAALASVVFYIYTAQDRSSPASPSTATPATPDKPARALKTTPLHPEATGKSTSRRAPTAADAPAPTKAPAAASPASPETSASSRTSASSASSGAFGEAAAQQVWKMISGCFDDKVRAMRVAVYIRPTGKVIRSFVGQRPGITSQIRACVRQKLPGVQLPLSLPKNGFVEWSFHLDRDPPRITLVRPVEMRGQSGATPGPGKPAPDKPGPDKPGPGKPAPGKPAPVKQLYE